MKDNSQSKPSKFSLKTAIYQTTMHSLSSTILSLYRALFHLIQLKFTLALKIGR